MRWKRGIRRCLAEQSTSFDRAPCRAHWRARPRLAPPMLLATIAGLLIAACGDSGRDLPDREARNVITGEIETWGLVAVPLGEIAVVEADRWTEGQISLNELNDLEAWSKAGLITLSAEDSPYPSQSRTWEQRYFRRGGESMRIIVAPTTAGLDLQSRTNLSDSQEEGLELPRARFRQILYGRLFSVTVEEVVENKEINSTTHLYRLIRGTMREDWSEEGTKVSRAAGRAIGDRKKFGVLLEYDPFEDQWRSVTWDLSNVHQQFTSRNVENYLAKISD